MTGDHLSEEEQWAVTVLGSTGALDQAIGSDPRPINQLLVHTNRPTALPADTPQGSAVYPAHTLSGEAMPALELQAVVDALPSGKFRQFSHDRATANAPGASNAARLRRWP